MAKQSYDIEGQIKTVKTEVEKLNNLLFAVVLIMLIMVAQMIMESWNTKGASYQNFSEQINQQNIQLQQLNDKIENLK